MQQGPRMLCEGGCVFRVVVQAQMMLTDADWTMSRLSAQLSACVRVCPCWCVRLNQISFIVEAVYPLLYNNWL